MEKREKVAFHAIKVALFWNIILALTKVLLGIFAQSIALIGDGIDTSVDVVKNLIALRGIKIAAIPPDKEHPYGHGRAETISSSIIGVSVIFAGILVAMEAINRFGETNAIDTLMFIGAGISIIGKIFLSSYMYIVGKRILSNLLIANAKDYFGDIISSLAVLVGAFLIHITGKVYFDSIASLAVASIIIYIGAGILKPELNEIMEKQDNPEIIKKVKETVSGFQFVYNPHKIRVRKLGTYYIVDMHLEFPKDMSVKEAHKIATSIEDKIKKEINSVEEVIVHIEPRSSR